MTLVEVLSLLNISVSKQTNENTDQSIKSLLQVLIEVLVVTDFVKKLVTLRAAEISTVYREGPFWATLRYPCPLHSRILSL
jgi:hypothetical protein